LFNIHISKSSLDQSRINYIQSSQKKITDMKYLNKYPFVIMLLISFTACDSDRTRNAEVPTGQAENIDRDTPHIVFVTGDEEYRSEESMPMLARILANRYGFRVSVAYAVTDGVIDPNRQDNIESLEALQDADMMVMYTRFRNIPDHQLRYVLDFAESGKPMAGFRTSTHAFQYGEDHPNHHLDFEWPQKVFGLPWISHYGGRNSTDVFLHDENADHPILNAVEPFHARSWLYHATTLLDNALPLLTGRAVEGADPGGDYFGDPYVVAWTNLYEGENGTSRVFFTTLGHPRDFFDVNMRRLSIQGIFWALGMEGQIPDEGLDVDFVGEYDPNPAGFGEQFKPNIRPEDIQLIVGQ
jgi:type 1 glutamine amidotransferase